MLSITAGKLCFSINEAGNAVTWRAQGTPLREAQAGDFWRLYVDDGKFRDCPVHSAVQTGVARQTREGLEIRYDGLTDDTGRRSDIRLTVRVTVTGEALRFEADIDNRDARLRVNECKLPFMDMSCLCDEKRAQDALYLPNGLGERRRTPWHINRVTSPQASSRMYLEPTQHEVFSRCMYPGHASMGWMGVESGAYFLYLAQQDTQFRTCDLTYGARADRTIPSLIMEITHFPLVRPGESVSIAPCYAALLPGDWREGSRLYRQWAEENWFEPPRNPSWLRDMTGREKVILRHGNGQILHTYDEIPRIMEKALACGLPLLEVYGWHAGGQDNDYPNYVPDPQQGGEEGLRRAIQAVHAMGGRISLYGQGELIDTWTDYFRQNGSRICRKNIMGEPYYCFFNYSSGGSLLRRFRCNITHTTACQATEEWHDLMTDCSARFLDYGADGVFWDMEGGPTPVICFDEAHLHGARGDGEALWRRKNIQDVHALCLARDCASGIEFPVDFLSIHADYTMGCWDLTPDPCYELFRHTFPEAVVTNRWCDDENPGYISMLNEAFLYGLRWNICMFRTRGTLWDVPDFAAYLTGLTGLQKRYARYLLRGRFRAQPVPALPDFVRSAVYAPDDGAPDRLIVLWNTGADICTVTVGGQRATLRPNSVACVECPDMEAR